MSTNIPFPSTSGSYEIDPAHSRIGFVARHAMVTKVRGSFNDFSGSGYFDVDKPENSHLRLTIQATSIDTRNADRDSHLRSNDFFAMDEYPEITFVSTAVESEGDSGFAVTGDLTMKGQTQPVTISFAYEGVAVDPYGAERIGLDGMVIVNRKDWGINFNAPLETGGVLIGERVALEFEVSATRA